MTSFQKLWEKRRNHVYDAYFTSAKEAEEARPREYEACVKIQSVYRGYTVRKKLRKERAAAENIQRIYRGYIARVDYEYMLRAKEKRERMAYFDRNATIIQKIWRGYYSRKHVHSYYRRKAYITGVVQKGEELLVRQKQQQEILEEELKHEKYSAIEAKFREEAARHHCPGSAVRLFSVRKFRHRSSEYFMSCGYGQYKSYSGCFLQHESCRHGRFGVFLAR